MSKTINVEESTYAKLYEIVAKKRLSSFEKQEYQNISFDKVINELIEKNR